MTLEERWAALFMMALGGRMFLHVGSDQTWVIRVIRPDGKVQLAPYPPAPQIRDIVVEPNTIAPIGRPT